MNKTSTGADAHVPFPLYHGSSSHYLANFRPGRPLSHWPYAQDALDLYQRVWTALERFGRTPDWWKAKMLTQESGHANWQHGELYVTPSERQAVRFAGDGGAHGGELLQRCREALDELAKLDPGKTTALLDSARGVRRFLEETGQPILIEFTDVQVCGLSPERERDDVSERLAGLIAMDKGTREHMGLPGFRLAPGCGVVARVSKASIEDIDDFLSDYQLAEIIDSDAWTGS